MGEAVDDAPIVGEDAVDVPGDTSLSDTYTSVEYRTAVPPAYARRALETAVGRATGEIPAEPGTGNQPISEGQVHGGVAQGINQARYENAVYDADGTLETDSLMHYAIPQASHVSNIDTRAAVTPSPRNPLGVKGIGEAGTIAAPPTSVNAVVDARSPLGIRHIDMPLTEERVWRAIQEATE